MASIKKRKTAGRGWVYEVRYRTPDGTERSKTLPTLDDAKRYASTAEADKARGAWIDPRLGRVTFGEYSTDWLEKRILRPRTRELYESLLRVHLRPTFGQTRVSAITTASVRSWHAHKRAEAGAHVAAKAYRLLRTILGTAVEDELIVKNACTIKNAGKETHDERPTATLDQVWELADAVEPRYRTLILVATFTGLRLGELAALRRRSFDLLHKTVTVREQLHQLDSGRTIIGKPKSDAGLRTVDLPAFLAPIVEEHLDGFVAATPETLVFAGPKGAPLTRSNWNTRFRRAASAVDGLPGGFRFHDLRHTGNTLAARTGASTKELMVRLGHSSPRAALLYQHATRERGAEIAAAIDELIRRPAQEA